MGASGTLSSHAIAELRHDLRTPVNLIVGYGEMLREELDSDDPRAAGLEAIVRAGRDALERISAVLPASGTASEADLGTLRTALATPQRHIREAISSLLATEPSDEFAADVRKIGEAAESLTRVAHVPPTGRAALTPRTDGRPPDDRGAPSTGRRVLVVDDVEDNRAVLERRLRKQGHEVVCAQNGRVALALVAEMSFDLVLLDVMMPEMDGYEVLAQLKGAAATREIPVIVISALDDLGSVVRCIEQGAEDYLTKPFDPVLLRARTQACLEKKQLRDREAEYLRMVDHITDAAGAVERGAYEPGLLSGLAQRDDELGRLARVFDSMAVGVRVREERLHQRITALGAEVLHATADVAMAALPGEAPTADRRVGTTLGGRYDILRSLGRGGMGMVYLAHDRELGEDVAVKVLRPELLQADDTVVERFKLEIRLARRISHRNVVRTHDLGEADGTYYVTMEHVHGITVRELLRTRGRLTVAATLALGYQLLEALAVAHEAGIVHRDIKPENALLDDHGVLKVMDFGIARLAERTTTITQSGLLIGTPAYMAPEQLAGETIDARADLYSAGALLYECLTGRPPFVAPTIMALIAKALTATPESPAALVGDVPPAVSALVLQLLAKVPEERPGSARAVLAQLAELS